MTASRSSPGPTAECGHCKVRLAEPEWSECLSDTRVLHIWQCPICGREFETTDAYDPRTLTDAEAVEDVFADLLVA